MTARKPELETKPKITIREAPPMPPAPVKIPLRCIWDSRLIVGADKTPSGTRYEFNTGEVKPVLEQDYQYLLSLQVKTPGCCGGAGGSSIPSIQKYFDEV